MWQPNNKKGKRTFYSSIFPNSSVVEYYRTHIVEFVQDIIFPDDQEYFLSDQQKEFLIAVQNNDKVSVKSGRGIGKTSSVSFIIMWFMCCFAEPKVVCSAPTYGTLKSALWTELALWLNKSIVKDIFEHTERRMYLKEAPKNWWTEPRTAKDRESSSGLHAENMLIIVDEASGIKEEIFESFDSTLTGKNNKFVLIANPTRINGPFYDTFHKFSRRWVNLTFNAEESPFVKQEQIDYYADKYGVKHDLYLTNIKGEFPAGNVDSFLKLSDVQAAFDRYEESVSNGEIEIGLDVARQGDDLTVLYWRQGYKVFPPKILSKNTIPEAARLVLDTVVEIRRSTGYDKKIKVKVDDTGVGGGVTDILKEDREHNIETIPCNNGGAGNDRYANEATVNWATVKDCLNFIALPSEEYVDGKLKNTSALLEELSSRRCQQDGKNRILIEPKSVYKKEFKSSPDRADALVLCFARKEIPNVVLKNLDTLDKNTVKLLHYAGDEKFCSIFYSKDMNVSVTYTSWDGNRLYVYDEFICDDSIINISTNVLQHGDLSRIIGNDRMFNDSGLGIDNKYRRFGVSLYECYDYDELVAVDALMNLTSQKRLIISPNCNKTIDQLGSWKISNKRLEQEREYGLCYSLSYTTFLLKRKIRQDVAPVIVKSYTNDGITKFNVESNKKSWMLM